jgi:SAM-dependent methyltransferase
MNRRTQDGGYGALYVEDLAWEAAWLHRTSTAKVDSVELLLKRNQIYPETLVEFGCGTGAVLARCQERALAKSYIGIDSSPDALAYVERGVHRIRTMLADIVQDKIPLPPVRLTILLSHVLEHIENPGAFLKDCIANYDFEYLLIEVPLEGLPLLKLKARCVGRNLAHKHVNFFNATELRELLEASGLKVIDARRYVPVWESDTVHAACDHHSLFGFRRMLKYLTQRYIPIVASPLWGRYYYSHFAVLCVKS